MKVFYFLSHCALILAQFIDAPTAFDTTELYSAPTGTSVYTFGAIRAKSTPSVYNTPSEASTPKLSQSQTTEGTTVETTSSTDNVKTTHPATIKELPTVQPSIKSTMSSEPGQAVVETVFKTHYTTAPCTTSSDFATESSQQITSTPTLNEHIQLTTSSAWNDPSSSSDACHLVSHTKGITVTTQVTDVTVSTVFVTQTSTLTVSV